MWRSGKGSFGACKVSRNLGIKRSENHTFNMAKGPEEAEEAQRWVERASKSRV